MSTYGDLRHTAPYIDACTCHVVSGDVCHHTVMQDSADAKLYAAYHCCQWAQLRRRPMGLMPNPHDKFSFSALTLLVGSVGSN